MGILEQVLKRNGPAGHSLREEHEAVKGSRLFRLGESLGLSVGWQRILESVDCTRHSICILGLAELQAIGTNTNQLKQEGS